MASIPSNLAIERASKSSLVILDTLSLVIGCGEAILSSSRIASSRLGSTKFTGSEFNLFWETKLPGKYFSSEKTG